MDENKNLSENERVRLENRAAWRDMTTAQKISYYREYYLLPTVVAVVAVFIIGSIVFHMLHAEPEPVLYVLASGCQFTAERRDAFTSEMAELLDCPEERIYIDDGHTYEYDFMVLMTFLASRAVDVVLVEEEGFEPFVSAGVYYDLREVYDEETLAAWEPYLVWTAGASAEDENGEKLEVCPYGIRLAGTDWLGENFLGRQGIILGLAASSQGPENGRACISRIMEQVLDE